MKIVTFAGGKGGTGKTAVCVNSAVVLARMGYRVLVVDLDRQAQAVRNLGQERGGWVYSLLTGVHGSRAVSEIQYSSVRPNLFVVPGDESVQSAEMYLIRSGVEKMYLRRRLENFFGGFDFVLVDTPSQGFRAELAVCAADLIVAPVAPKDSDADGLRMFAGYLAQLEVVAPVIVVTNRMDLRTKQSAEIDSTLRTEFKLAKDTGDLDNWYFAPVALPESIAVDRAGASGRVVSEVEKASPFARGIESLASMIVGASCK